MRKLLILLAVGLVLAGIAAAGINITRLYRIFQPIVVCLSIMAAAIFVRLNRGMPSLEWKAITPKERMDLTGAILRLAKDYVIGLGITFFTICLLIGFSLFKPSDLMFFTISQKKIAVFVFFSSLFSSLIWMGYVIWRDLDIVKLQKTIIDSAATKEENDAQIAEASAKIEASKSSGLRAPPTTVRNWQN